MEWTIPAKDREARRIYQTYHTLVLTVVTRILEQAGTSEDCEECVQDVLWEFLQGPDKWDPGRSHGSHSTLFQAGDFAGDTYRLRITFTDDSVIEGYHAVTYEKELNLIPAEAKAAVADSHAFPEGTVTVLVSQDSSGVTNFVEWSEASEHDLPGHSLELQFIGASGKRYPAAYHNTYLEGFERVEYYPWVPVEEPITAVTISQVSFWDRYSAQEHCYKNLDWVISLP